MFAMTSAEITVNGQSYGAFMAHLKQVSPEAHKQLRKEFAKVARTQVVAKQREAVMGTDTSAKSSGGHRAREAYALSKRKGTVSAAARKKITTGAGLRASIARTLRIKQTKDGLQVVAAGSRMPAGQTRLPHRMNKGQWRHPVFGNRAVWVTQTTSPNGWFDRPAKAALPAVKEAAEKAFKQVVDQL